MNGFHTTRRRGFTLVELLVVVSLMSLLLALGMPAFSRMARGNQVEECARSIKLGLEQAQLRAASERRYVAVIFPNGSDSDVSADLRRYRLGGFRCAYVVKDSSNNYTFRQWLDPAWRNAPNGAILTKVGKTVGKFSRNQSGYVTGCATGTDSTMTESSGADSSLIELQKLSGGTGNCRTDSGAEINSGNHSAIVFSPYGGTVDDTKTYLLISEAEVNGDSIKYPSGGSEAGRTANYLVLKINNLTGRVEFINEE